MRGSPQLVANEMQRRATALRQALIDGQNNVAQTTRAKAQEQSSGPYTQAALTAMGHPYATRDPRPPMDPRIINIQSGRFFRSWVVRPTITTPDKIWSRVANTSPEAALLETGTRLMIARHTPSLIVARMQPRYALMMWPFVRRALRI
jgi:hypothetical protein